MNRIRQGSHSQYKNKINSSENTQAKQIAIGKEWEWKILYITKKRNLPEFPLQYESSPGSKYKNKFLTKHSNE